MIPRIVSDAIVQRKSQTEIATRAVARPHKRDGGEEAVVGGESEGSAPADSGGGVMGVLREMGVGF